MRQSKNIFGLLGLLLFLTLVLVGGIWLANKDGEDSVDSTHETSDVEPVYNSNETDGVAYWKLNSKLDGVLDQALLSALRDKYGITTIDPDMMSRCSSRINYSLDSDEERTQPVAKDGFYYGTVNVFLGCDIPSSFSFRIASDGSTVEVKAADGSYVSVEEGLNGTSTEPDMSLFNPIYAPEDSIRTEDQVGDVLAWKFAEDMEGKLNKLALDPIRQKYGIALNPDLMSRCTSGVDYDLDANEMNTSPILKDGFYYGKIWVNQGCETVRDDMLFRISTDGTEVQMKDSDGSYISVEDWLKL